MSSSASWATRALARGACAFYRQFALSADNRFGREFDLPDGLTGKSAEQAAAAVSEEIKAKASAHPEKIIAVPDVTSRAMEVADLIRNSNAKLATGAGIKAISESLPNAAKLIELEASMTARLLQQQPTLDSLERQQLLCRNGKSWQRAG